MALNAQACLCMVTEPLDQHCSSVDRRGGRSAIQTVRVEFTARRRACIRMHGKQCMPSACIVTERRDSCMPSAPSETRIRCKFNKSSASHVKCVTVCTLQKSGQAQANTIQILLYHQLPQSQLTAADIDFLSVRITRGSTCQGHIAQSCIRCVHQYSAHAWGLCTCPCPVPVRWTYIWGYGVYIILYVFIL